LVPLNLQFSFGCRENEGNYGVYWNSIGARFAMFLFYFPTFSYEPNKGFEMGFFSFGLLFEAVMEEMNRKISNDLGDSDSEGKGRYIMI
jgi:hypothetical protein